MSETPERKEHRLQMLIEPSLVSRIDQWRAKQPGLPSRSEAIRRLVEASLEAADKPAAKSPPKRA
jgi:metal-responsive CopG/Arc/MetJ family transcriptional regulator